MTNEQLIEQAKEAMAQLSASSMLEYEQSAYNCLRLCCKRLQKIQEASIAIIEAKAKADENILDGQSPNAGHWGYEEGVLLTNQQAIAIYNACFGE